MVNLAIPNRQRSRNGKRGPSAAMPPDHAYVKVERIGKVTIYRRGNVYMLYYRERGRTVRPTIDGNLTTARATASKVNAALVEERPTPLSYRRTSPRELFDQYLDSIAHVQGLALRTQDRYRAALTLFVEFCGDQGLGSIELVGERE